MNLRLLIKFTSIYRRRGLVKPFKKWIPIISLFAVIIVIIAGCGDREVPTPTGVTATPGNGQVTISWTAVTDVTSYNIYWSTTPGVTIANGTKITGVASPYVQSGLINGITYYYVVTAVNTAGESTPSPQISAIPSVAPTPAAPTEVTATLGNGQVTIAWTAVSGATSYNIYWSNTSGVTTANGTKITGAASPYIQPGLINDTTYYYVVTAVNGNGESTPPSQVSAVPSVAPFIRATVLSLPGGTNPFGWLEQVSVCIDSTCNSAITDATVTINGNIVTYDAAKGLYQANLTIAAGAAINLRVTLGVNTYTSSASQFATAPSTADLAFAKTWLHADANTINWTGGTAAGAVYIIGIMDNSAHIVYPSPAALVRNGFFEVPINSTTFTIPANSLAAGSFQLFTGISTPGISINAPGTGISIPGALSGSGLWVGQVSAFIPITVQ
jgi:hypothetical protein